MGQFQSVMTKNFTSENQPIAAHSIRIRISPWAYARGSVYTSINKFIGVAMGLYTREVADKILRSVAYQPPSLGVVLRRGRGVRGSSLGNFFLFKVAEPPKI